MSFRAYRALHHFAAASAYCTAASYAAADTELLDALIGNMYDRIKRGEAEWSP